MHERGDLLQATFSLAQGQQGANVGDKIRVKLISTDVQRGYIDFARA